MLHIVDKHKHIPVGVVSFPCVAQPTVYNQHLLLLNNLKHAQLH